ncbi:MAG: phosphoribosylglycinamide formyltransferase [Bacteroidetes bacterium]|nr:phosphoribosylglycinamide formyltransferase [Bacteroidota bacterium]MBU1720130.1 phosphoribosylglycinamide formyltransferase [Bacteroidota bacterium]
MTRNAAPKIAIFASGSGSNAQRITEYFRERKTAEVVRIYTNNPSAYVIERAKNLNLPCHIFDRKIFRETEQILEQLRADQTDLIVLAGFLWLVPANLIAAFPNRIINIHPALLPKYGGKGMYGMRVHDAVIEACEDKSGITIHLVDEIYDNGKTLYQAVCSISDEETPETLAEKIHKLEYAFFPQVIEQYLEGHRAESK